MVQDDNGSAADFCFLSLAAFKQDNIHLSLDHLTPK